jgi:S1-C subfamily serine protease
MVTCTLQVTTITESVGGSVIGLRRGARRGSGVVVAEGRVAVLAHSLAEDRVEVVFGEGRSAEGVLTGVDRRRGIAVLEVATNDAPVVRWSQSPPEIGDAVFALGNPGSGLRATEGRVSAAPLTVRGRHGRRVEGVIEHTAPLPRGAGGGPLVDATGAVLGVNALRADPGFLLALPAAVVRPAVDRLLEGRAGSGYLGVALAPPRASRRMRAAVGLPASEGLLVRRVEPGAPAERAGVLAGDLLVGLEQTDVKDLDDVFRALDAAEGPLSIKLLRGSERIELTVELGGDRA